MATGRSRGRRRGQLVRTGHLQRIRRAVNTVRLQVLVKERTRKKRKVKRRSTGASGGKKRKGGRKRKCKPKAGGRPNYRERQADAALLDNVRAALGLSAPRVHWSQAEGAQGSQGLNLFGSAYDLEPLGSEGEEEEHEPQGSTRVMPRHQAVQRLALSRRRRQKMVVDLPSAAPGPPDLLAGILGAQSSFLAPPKDPAPRLDARYAAPKVKTAPGLNPAKGPSYSTSTSSTSSSSTNPSSSPPTATEHHLPMTPLLSALSPPPPPPLLPLIYTQT